MVYLWDLGEAGQVYIENQGTQTIITLTDGQGLYLRHIFETGVWRVAPILLREAADTLIAGPSHRGGRLILQIGTTRGHIFMRIEEKVVPRGQFSLGREVSFLQSPPLLIGAEILPHQQISHEGPIEGQKVGE
jgi:hypothetical protein